MQTVERLVGFNSEMIWRPLEILGQGPQMAEQKVPEFFLQQNRKLEQFLRRN